jgi:hypothetical protein
MRVVHDVAIDIDYGKPRASNGIAERDRPEPSHWVASFLDISAEPNRDGNAGQPALAGFHHNEGATCQSREALHGVYWIV